MAPGRTPFSKEDEDLIVEWIATRHPQESGRKGNELWKLLANSRRPAVARHTWQSWRDRYVKNENEFNIKIKRYLKKKKSERAVDVQPKPKQPSVQPKATSSRPVQKKVLPLPPSDDYSGSIFPRDQTYEGRASKPLAKVQEESEDDESQVDQMLTDPMVSDDDVMSPSETEHTSFPLKKKKTSDQDSGFYESDSSISPARPVLPRRGAPPKHVERPFGGLTLDTTKAWPPSRKRRSRSSDSERETPPPLPPKKRRLHRNRSDAPPPDSGSGSDGIYTPPPQKSTITSPLSQPRMEEGGESPSHSDQKDSDHDPLFTQLGYEPEGDAPGSSSRSDNEEHSDHDPLFTQPEYEPEGDSDESGEKSPLFTQRPGRDVHTPEPQSSPLFTPLSQAKTWSQSKFSEPASPLMRYSDSQTRVNQRDSFVISSQAKHARQTESQRRQPSSQRQSLARIESPQTPLSTQVESQLSPLFTQVESQRTRSFTQIGSPESSPSQRKAQRQRARASLVSSERGVEEAPLFADPATSPSTREQSSTISSPRTNSSPPNGSGKRKSDASGNIAVSQTRDTVSTQSRGKDQAPAYKSTSSTHLGAPSAQLETQSTSLFTQAESQQSPLFTQLNHRSKPFVASPDVFNPRPSKQDDIFVQGSSKDSIFSTKRHTTVEPVHIPRIDFRAEYLRSKSGSRHSSIAAMRSSQIDSLKEKAPQRRSLPIWLDNTGRESNIPSRPSIPRSSLSQSALTRHRPLSVDRFSVTPLVSPSHPLLSHTAGSVVDPDEERQVIHALGVQTALESYARDYDVSLNDLYAVYKAVGSIQAAKNFAQERQIENKKRLEHFILSATNSKIAPDTNHHSPSPGGSRGLTANFPSISQQHFRIRSPTSVEEANLEEDYSPPSKTRAGRLVRLSQQGRAEEALERERQRASATHSGGRAERREKTHTPVLKPKTDELPIWGEAEDEMLQNGEEDMVAALQVKFGKDEVQRRSARFLTEILRVKGVA